MADATDDQVKVVTTASFIAIGFLIDFSFTFMVTAAHDILEGTILRGSGSGGTNVSCQLKFRLFVSCRLNFWPFVSCQLIGF